MAYRRNKNGLTPNQQTFADEWLKDHNGARSYKCAYSKVKRDNVARVNASRLLTNANVKAYIDMRQAEKAAEYDVTQDRILEEESSIAFSNILHLFNDNGQLHDLRDISDRTARAISKIEVGLCPVTKTEFISKIHFWDKGRSLERVSKHLGMYEKDNQQKRPSLQEVFGALSETSPELAEKVRDALLRKVDAADGHSHG